MVQINGLRIMTDPVFGDRVSPFTTIGPKRFQEAPIKLSDVPELDAVIISHNHYDHLDMDSIKALHARVDIFITPIGGSGPI
jgi:L-ascorbate metabolism protein UlaG (beta-lactamase superfamily)